MKKFLAILLLFGTACTTATFSVVRADKPIPIAEQLGLRPIDPQPIAVAFVNPDAPASNAKNVIETKDWTLTNAKMLPDGYVLEMNNQGSALSPSFPTQPGCFFFQIDTKLVGQARSGVTAGDASFGFYVDNMYAYGNRDWATFSHFFRIPETESQMQIGVNTSFGSHSMGTTVQSKSIQLLPAQALLNLAPKGQPQYGIGHELAVSRTEPTGEFLPLGRMERIGQDSTTTSVRRTAYSFWWERGGPDPWHWSNVDAGFASSAKTETYFPPVSIEARPIERIIAQPQHAQVIKYEEIILKFELRPISIGANGEFNVLPPIPFLSANLSLSSNYSRDYTHHRAGIYWSTDGKTWNDMELKTWADLGLEPRPGHSIPPTFPAEIFPCERLYVKLKPVAGAHDLSHLQYLRFNATLDTDQYSDYGRTSYFRVVPGEAKESGMTINPLYTARNQVYFLYRNNTDKELQPEFSTRLRYTYTATFHDNMFGPARAEGGRESGPQEVVFRAIGNTVEAFDDITCHWEVLGDSDKIPPGEERICVFSLETSKIRSSSHFQRGPFVSDVFDVEFDLGTYKLPNEQMRFFPPRLAIE